MSILTSLDAAESRFQSAQIEHDLDELDALLHDELRFTGPDGAIGGKDDDLAAHRAGVYDWDAVEQIGREVQILEGVGITRASMSFRGRVAGQPFSGLLSYTRTWAWTAEGWRIVAAHVSRGL